ncbi:MAG: ABC transporter ATP-binding protein [Lachnospiraceae bacterium]
MEPLIRVRDLCKVYNPGENEVRALDHVDLSIDKGELVGIIGHSGSGKSTLMNMLGCLDVPTSGNYYLNGKDVSNMTDDELSDVRNVEIGFIFQGFNLIPNLTAKENVELPLIYRGVSKKEREDLAVESLKAVGLEHRMDHKPSEMSGGQQQRVAIARAIAARPPVILADEPTGNLDSRSTQEIMEVLKELHRSGRTVILITHDDEIAAQVNRVIRIKDGKVEADFINEQTGEKYNA